MTLSFWDFSGIRFANTTGPTLPRRQRLEVEGFYGVDLGDKIRLTVQPAIVATVSVLSERVATQNGELVQTLGKTTVGDGVSLRFIYYAGVTTGADGHIVINTVDGRGQYRALEPTLLGYMDPRWFGAVPTTSATTVVDCQSAIERAITACVAFDLRYVRLTAGFYGVRSTSAATAISIPSSITFACAELGGATIVPITQVTGGTEKSIFAVTGTNVRVENVSIYRKDSSQVADPRSPLAASQQLHGFTLEVFNVTFRNVYVKGVTGCGFRDSSVVGSFQVLMDNCHTDNTGSHGWWVTGNNTWSFDNCSAGSVPNGHAGWKIDSGQFTAIACNGLYAAYEYPGLPVGWREEDTRVWESGAAQANLFGCNLEEFTSYAYYNTATTAPTMIGCTIFSVKGGMPSSPGAGDGCVRALYSGLIDRPKILDSSTKLFAPHEGFWGDPETRVNDGCPFETNVGQPPYFYVGEDHGNIKLTTSAAIVALGKITLGQPLGPKQAVKHPWIEFGNYFHGKTFLSASGAAVPGMTMVDSTAAVVNVSLTDIANAPIGFQYMVHHSKGGNNVVVADSGGNKFIDETGAITTSYTINGIGRRVCFELATIWDTTLGVPAFVNGWSIASKNY